MSDQPTNVESAFLTLHEAATLLRISDKTLWNHTEPRGNKIPCIRYGKTVRYSRAAIDAWVTQQTRPANGQPLAAELRVEVEST